jgi:DNA-binding YbaB/EbfC family protein
MFGNVGELLKMQKQMKDIQKRIKKAEHTGEAEGGMVKAVVSGEFTLVSLSIDDSIVKAADKKKIEKAVYTAVNEAVAKGKAFAANEMKALTGGLNIPGLSDFF